MNHGPDPKGLEDLFAGAPSTPDAPDASDLSPAELAVRELLHRAVGDVEPREGTLDHLRHAVPARRARRRQALVGMAAAAVFVGTAIPALVHVSGSSGSTANPSIAGQASQAQGGTGQGSSDEAGSDGSAPPYAKGDADTGGSSAGPDAPDNTAAGTATGGDLTATVPPAPECAAGQLGQATATLQRPDASGTVYGTFRVTNASIAGCTVKDTGEIWTAALGAADAARITVTGHTAGDAASGLPDPALSRSEVMLKPGTAYEVKFAWVPSETCPSTGGGGSGGDSGGNDTPGDGVPSPAPSETATQQTNPMSGSAETSSVAPQLGEEDGTTDGSVVVSFTPESAAGSATVTLSDACAGTVYRTGLLEATGE